jgi:hypothetical protein
MTQEQETCCIHMFMRLHRTSRKLLQFLVKFDLNSLFLFVTSSKELFLTFLYGTFCFSVALYPNHNEYVLENTAVSQCSLPVPCSSTSRQKLWVVKHQFSFFGRHSFVFTSQFYHVLNKSFTFMVYILFIAIPSSFCNNKH